MGRISAGSYDLNKWLFGGYDTDIVSVIYGAPGTGKTNFCLLATVSQVKKGNKVIFIDTEGGFSSERVRQILGDEIEQEKIMANILLLKPTNFNEQKEAFRRLEKSLDNEVSLIVVDGMTILYRIDFAAAREKDGKEMREQDGNRKAEIQRVNSELAEHMRILAEIARKKNIPVIVTNQVYEWENERRMVGGDILYYWAKCLIELVNENGRRTAILRKHRSLPEKALDFLIVNSGIKKRRWI